jgi:hypothetical protein
VREKVNQKMPLHINFSYKTQIRNKDTLMLLKRAILNARLKGLKIIHYSMQTNHIHIIVEAMDNKILTTGMRSLTVTFAKGLKKEKIQVKRYHLHILRTLREAKNAIRYVLFNQQKHETSKYSRIDEVSSILTLSCALDLIKNFVHENKITITLKKNERCFLDTGRSYLANEGLKQLAKKRGPEGPRKSLKIKS